MKKTLVAIVCAAALASGGCGDNRDEIQKAGDHLQQILDQCLDSGKPLRECRGLQ